MGTWEGCFKKILELELPAQESRTLPDLDINQDITLIATAPNPKEVEEPENEISDLNREVIPQLNGPVETTKETLVCFTLIDIGDIFGPKLAPQPSSLAKGQK